MLHCDDSTSAGSVDKTYARSKLLSNLHRPIGKRVGRIYVRSPASCTGGGDEYASISALSSFVTLMSRKSVPTMTPLTDAAGETFGYVPS
ncbi:unnamed protein product [Protopolystoma xenopodis]|uniref:Uncharacterized protein n=1 Tax=Protopolystoma xenopodis TaxID=117903 RepID=A0A448XJN7_9PLAT|nr:unnamed protein product [Protopolystoma xenopodis]